jgi:hypothetical protein
MTDLVLGSYLNIRPNVSGPSRFAEFLIIIHTRPNKPSKASVIGSTGEIESMDSLDRDEISLTAVVITNYAGLGTLPTKV